MWCSSGPLLGDAGSPAQARDFCTARLSTMVGNRDRAVVEDAELIVSELVTNAVNAATTTAEIVIMARDHQVKIAVRDDAPGRPLAASPEPEVNHGRGLLIVSQLASDWGVEYSGGGKSVWAELVLPR